MKREFRECPSSLAGQELYGFDWKEHVAAIPSPLVVVTTYKANGKTNATMQSWLTFSNGDGFFCIFADVSKYGHMYSAVKGKGSLVINFPSADIYGKCYATIAHNQYEEDEIQAAGLTAEAASLVDAPRIRECFLNLECEYEWERELTENSPHIVLCVKVVNVVMEENYYDERRKGRYGDMGYLYNIHSPANPENGEREKTCVGTIKKMSLMMN